MSVKLIGCAKDGLLAMLDQECQSVGGNAEQLCRKLQGAHGTSKLFGVVRQRPGNFVVEHFAGPVEYTSQTFLEKNRDELSADLVGCLKGSSDEFMRQRFVEHDRHFGTQEFVSVQTGSRRVVAAKKHSVSGEFRGQLSSLMQRIQTTEPHFVRCIKPNPESRAGVFHRPSVVQQLRYQGVLQAIEVSRAGYPMRLNHRQGVLDFRSLARREDKAQVEAQMLWGRFEAAAQVLFQGISESLPRGSWALGRTRLFLKREGVEALSSALSRARRDAAIRAQAWWRGRLCRWRFIRLARAALRLQAGARALLARRVAQAMLRQRAAVAVQSARRMVAARRLRLRSLLAARFIQYWLQSRRLRAWLLRAVVAARRLQWWQRASRQRWRAFRRRWSARLLQKVWRGHRGRLVAREQAKARERRRSAASRVIGSWRRHVCRRLLFLPGDETARSQHCKAPACSSTEVQQERDVATRHVALERASLGELLAVREELKTHVAALSRHALVVRKQAGYLKQQALQMSRQTIRAQAWWRGRLCRWRFLRLVRAALRLQAGARAMMARRLVQSMQRQRAAVVVQSARRMVALRRLRLRSLRAACIIQFWFRSRRAQAKLLRAAVAARRLQWWQRAFFMQRRRALRRWCSACLLQKVWRGHRGRLVAREQAKAQERRSRAASRVVGSWRRHVCRRQLQQRCSLLSGSAGLLQRVWRGHRGRLAAHEEAKAKKADDLKQQTLKLSRQTIRVQAWWRGRLCRWRFLQVVLATLLLQAAARALMARRLMQAMRRQRAAVVVQSARRMVVARRLRLRSLRAASVILYWLQSRRLRARLLRAVAAARRLQRWQRASMQWRRALRRWSAACHLQRAWTGYRGRLVAHEQAKAQERRCSVCLLQRVWRGHTGRRAAREEEKARERCRSAAGRLLGPLRRYVCRRRLQRRRALRRWSAACLIQRAWRGHGGRLAAREEASARERRGSAAGRVLKSWRRHVCRRLRVLPSDELARVQHVAPPRAAPRVPALFLAPALNSAEARLELEARGRFIGLQRASLGELLAAREELQARVAAMSRRSHVARKLADDMKERFLELSRWTAFGMMSQVAEKYFGCGCECSGRDRRDFAPADAGLGDQQERSGFPEPARWLTPRTAPPSARGSAPPSARRSPLSAE
ncbi:unnamed protein product [Prorocentrum cordatum]|uniref:Myosin motor domain-containing protein n=1 Tax=Prorocentrum cordatum TaxID=2364126 RepID=A0ABN9TXK3_9DINO|nr:unnamed protein product [Polarella glacialis]